MRTFFTYMYILLAGIGISSPPSANPKAWSYDNDYTGQEEWGLISPDYAACGVGTQQSPIHIARTELTRLPELEFHYSATDAVIEHKGFTIEIRFADETQWLEEAGEKFLLQAIHFHTPSEHIIKDTFYAMELQFIHVNAQGKRLIVASMGVMEKALPGFDTVLAHIPEKRGHTREFTFDASVLLPVYRGYYAYDGSLTTPPCTEGVRWRVLKSPIDVSRPQIALLSHHTKRNARLTQPVYMRTVKEFKDNW